MPSGRNIASTVNFPAPTGGWNARDALTNMPVTDAIILDNIYPSTGDVSARSGSLSYATGLGGSVQTLVEYSGTLATQFFAAANGNIWNITTSTPSSVVSGMTNNYWQTAMFRNRLFMMNGADAPRRYDGTTWDTPSFTGTSNTGVSLTQANLIQPFVFKNRLYAVEKNSMRLWFGDVNAITGVMEGIDYSSIFSLGGTLQACASWSRDSGDGADDVFIMIANTGEVLAYIGSSPISEDWELVGRFRMAPPIGRRCFTSLGPDLLVVTQSGLIPMSSVLRLGGLSSGADSVSDKIRNVFIQSALSYGANDGWQVIYYPTGSYLLVNVPISSTSSHQYIMNTLTGAWCRFTGQNAFCWGQTGNSLYFGGASGVVYRANTGESDSGVGIEIDCQTAFSYHGTPNNKKYNLVRPVIRTDSDLTFGLRVNVDFSNDAPDTAVNIGSSGSSWDSSDWDTAGWSGNSSIRTDIYSVSGIGRSGSVRIKASLKDTTLRIFSFDIVFEQGGMI